MSTPDDQLAMAVTVVIPAFQAERTVWRAVRSVIEDSSGAAAITIVEDGGDELRLPDELAASAPIDLVNLPKRGAAAARNAGLAAVATPAVMFLDADDFVDGGLMAGLARRLAQSRADVAFGPMQRYSEESGRWGERYVPDYTAASDLLWKWIALGLWVNPASVMWNTAFLKSIGGWNETLARNMDGELVIRAMLRGARLATSSSGRGVYVEHSAARISGRADNLRSVLEAGEGLLAITPAGVSVAVQRRAMAAYFYMAAMLCDRYGERELAAEALVRSRALGCRLPGGAKWYPIARALRSLPAGHLLWSMLLRLGTAR